MSALKKLVEELDPLLHERGRLAIVSALAAIQSISFSELRETVGMTDGNLSVHLLRLQERGYVEIEKSFVGRKPLTTCKLTESGQMAFTRYLDDLERIVTTGRKQKP